MPFGAFVRVDEGIRGAVTGERAVAALDGECHQDAEDDDPGERADADRGERHRAARRRTHGEGSDDAEPRPRVEPADERGDAEMAGQVGADALEPHGGGAAEGEDDEGHRGPADGAQRRVVAPPRPHRPVREEEGEE